MKKKKKKKKDKKRNPISASFNTGETGPRPRTQVHTPKHLRDPKHKNKLSSDEDS